MQVRGSQRGWFCPRPLCRNRRQRWHPLRAGAVVRAVAVRACVRSRDHLEGRVQTLIIRADSEAGLAPLNGFPTACYDHAVGATIDVRIVPSTYTASSRGDSLADVCPALRLRPEMAPN